MNAFLHKENNITINILGITQDFQIPDATSKMLNAADD